jgi:hypothetical protein
MSAQYHASTRNGNFSSTRLKKRSSNTSVLGVVTILLNPKNCSLRRRNGAASCETAVNVELPDVRLSEDDLPWTNKPTTSSLFFWPRCAGHFDLPALMLTSFLRLNHAPPKSSDTTTSGSRNAPTAIASRRCRLLYGLCLESAVSAEWQDRRWGQCACRCEGWQPGGPVIKSDRCLSVEGRRKATKVRLVDNRRTCSREGTREMEIGSQCCTT